MKTETLKITGMTCDGCTSKVAHALKSIPGVHDVAVSLKNNEATVHYDEQLPALDQLKLAIHDEGYGVEDGNVVHGQHAKSGCC